MALNMTRHSQIVAILVLTSALVFSASPPGVHAQQPADAAKQSREEPALNIPNRPANKLYSGEQGEQHSEIKFVPLTRKVTAKIHIEDPNGYFLQTFIQKTLPFTKMACAKKT